MRADVVGGRIDALGRVALADYEYQAWISVEPGLCGLRLRIAACNRSLKSPKKCRRVKSMFASLSNIIMSFRHQRIQAGLLRATIQPTKTHTGREN